MTFSITELAPASYLLSSEINSHLLLPSLIFFHTKDFQLSCCWMKNLCYFFLLLVTTTFFGKKFKVFSYFRFGYIFHQQIVQGEINLQTLFYCHCGNNKYTLLLTCAFKSLWYWCSSLS